MRFDWRSTGWSGEELTVSWPITMLGISTLGQWKHCRRISVELTRLSQIEHLDPSLGNTVRSVSFYTKSHDILISWRCGTAWRRRQGTYAAIFIAAESNFGLYRSTLLQLKNISRLFFVPLRSAPRQWKHTLNALLLRMRSLNIAQENLSTTSTT